MKQEEFFKLLDRRLSVIEDGERQDILNEYQQHIAMKIQEDHISEEEALADFGDVDSFADEILSAYHVRTGDTKQQAVQMASGIGQKAKSLWKKIREFLRNCGRKTVHFFGVCGHKIGHFFKACWAKLRGLFRREKKAEKPMVEGTPVWKRGFSWICYAVRTLVRWCFNLLWGCLGAMFGAFGAMILVLLGACVVVAAQGYPLIGTTVLLLGLLLCSGALTILFCRMIRKKEENRNA